MLSLRRAYAWKFSLGIPICSYNSLVMAALVFRIKACNCQSSATSFTVFQNPWRLCNLHELHNRELHSPLPRIYANNRQMGQHHPNKHCFPQSLFVLLCFSKWSSTESRNIRSRIFVSSSGSFSVTYSNITNVLVLKDNVRLGKILQLIFYKLPFYKLYTFCFSDLIPNFVLTLFWQKD